MGLHIYNEPVAAGVEQLTNTIRGALGNNQTVLWLLSAGSNVDITLQVTQQLGTAGVGFVKAALVDERYGDPGHADSNYQKLVDAGFESTGIPLTPVLLPNGESLQATAGRYESVLHDLMSQAQCVVIQLGIGADGHTAGVLPHSIGVDSTKLIESYDGPDFRRITMTLGALRRVDQAFVFCYGADKATTLRQLVDADLPLAEQPAQILKKLPSVYLYNDQVGGEIE